MITFSSCSIARTDSPVALATVGLWTLHGDDEAAKKARGLLTARGFALIGLGLGIRMDELALGVHRRFHQVLGDRGGVGRGWFRQSWLSGASLSRLPLRDGCRAVPVEYRTPARVWPGNPGGILPVYQDYAGGVTVIAAKRNTYYNQQVMKGAKPESRTKLLTAKRNLI